jgi:hypothetical protein
LSESNGTRVKRVTPAEGLDGLRVAGIDPLRLVAREQNEFWFQVQFVNSIEESFGVLLVSKESLQCFGGNDNGLGRCLSNGRDGRGHQRLTMFSYLQPGQALSQRVVRASPRFAPRHEIAVVQQLRSVLLQEPLD